MSSHSFGKHQWNQNLWVMCFSSLPSLLCAPHLTFNLCSTFLCNTPTHSLLCSFCPFFSLEIEISHTSSSLLSDWSTPAQEKVLLSWTLSCRLACVQAPSRAWRPMCSGWILPRSCPPGLICWWRAATTLLSSSRRSPRVQTQILWPLVSLYAQLLHLHVENYSFVLNYHQSEGIDQV